MAGTGFLVLGLEAGPRQSLSAEESATKPLIPLQLLEASKKPNAGFPLRAGYRWTYSTKGRYSLFLETSAGSTTEEFAYASLVAKRDSFFWASSLVLGRERKSLKAELGPWHSAILLAEPLGIGKTWTCTDTTRFPLERSCEGLEFKATVIGKERVKVPAGELDAWRIEYVLLWHLGTECDLRMWYAPGIGFVKIEKWRESSLGEKRPMAEPIVQELERIEWMQTAHRIDYPSESEPVANLPDRVAAPAGQATLFADFTDIWDGQVVLYLVNKTGDSLVVPTEDDDFFVKLEALSSSGDWKRAERHVYSFCGNVRQGRFVGPGEFVTLLGYQPLEGEPCQVRFKAYDQLGLVSNSGPGRAAARDIRRARYDEMALRSATPELLEEIFFKSTGSPPEEIEEARDNALDRMRSWPDASYLPVLERLLSQAEEQHKWDDRLLDILNEHSKALLLAYAKESLRSGTSERRAFVLGNQALLPFDQEVFDRLMADALKPDTKELPSGLKYLASTARPEVKPLLTQISESKAYPAAASAEAALLLAHKNAEQIIEITASTPDEDCVPPQPRGTLLVRFMNLTEEPVSFSFSSVSEIFRIFLRLDGEQIPLRDSVIWYGRRPKGASFEFVTLPPLEHYAVKLSLRDYFDVPPAAEKDGSSLEAAVILRLPGTSEAQAATGWVQVPWSGGK